MIRVINIVVMLKLWEKLNSGVKQCSELLEICLSVGCNKTCFGC